MQPTAIVSLALVMILVGGAALYYQSRGSRKFESLIIVIGLALVASGIAMCRDGLSGSRDFLWMMPGNASGHPPA